MMRYFICCGLFLLTAPSLFAQACCSGGTPLSSNLGIQSVADKTAEVQLTYDYNTQRSLVESSNLLAENNRARNTHSVLLRGTYAFNARWSVSTLLSWVQQEEEITRVSNENFKAIARGIGDIVGFVQYTFDTRSDDQWVLAGGVKVPVGATDRLDPETGIPLNPDLQPGTGAWDGIIGLSYLHSGLFQRPTMSFSFSSTYRLTFPDDRFGGLQSYEFGDEWQTLFGLSDQIWSPYLSASLFFRYRTTQKDKTGDNLLPNTGGHWLHFVPGLEISFTPQMDLSISGEVPLYRHLTGTQLTTTYRVKVGMSYRFEP